MVVLGNLAFNEKPSAINAEVKVQEAAIERNQGQVDSVAAREAIAEREDVEYASRKADRGVKLVKTYTTTS